MAGEVLNIKKCKINHDSLQNYRVHLYFALTRVCTERRNEINFNKTKYKAQVQLAQTQHII